MGVEDGAVYRRRLRRLSPQFAPRPRARQAPGLRIAAPRDKSKRCATHERGCDDPPPPPPRAPEAGRFAPRTLFAFLFCLTCVWGAPGSGEAQGNTEADCGTRDEAATRTVTCETAQSPYERVHIDARSAGAGIGTVKLVVGANARVEATAPSDAVGVLALERDIEIEIGTGARILSRVPPGGTPGSYFGGGTGVARWSGEFGVRPTGRTAVTVRESASVYGALNGISVYGDGSVTAMGTVESGFDWGIGLIGDGAVTVGAGGSVSSAGAAIELHGNGAVSVFGTATGGFPVVSLHGSSGVSLHGSGTVTVHEGAAVTGTRHGIHATDIPNLREDLQYGQGDISIVSRGRVAATGTRANRHALRASISNPGSENDIEIDVLGGAVETAGWWSAAVYGWHGGLGSADVEIGANAVVRAKAASATGVSAGLYNNRNAEGRVVIRHAGAIEAGDHGILAWAKRSSGSTFDGSMTADDAARKEPMIHVVSSGTVTVRKPEEERASRDDLSAEDLRDLQDLDESNGVRLEALQELDDILGLVEVGVGAYPRDGWWLVDTIAGGDDRLSPAERAVLAAAATGGDLKAALAALPASAPYIGFNGEQIYGEEYRNAVQRLAFANAYDSGDIQIDITGGRIDSSGDGVVAFSGFPHDRNGAMTVNVEAGAVIAAGRYGILVDGGGLDSETGRRKHFVSVDGSVSGASAGIHLPNGGTVSVGSSGRVGAASGVAIDAVAGDLYATVAGMVAGDILGRGAGDHVVDVARGGVVAGDIRLAGSMVTVAEGGRVTGRVRLASPGSTVVVDGSIGRADLVRGGMVTVGPRGRVESEDGVGVSSEDGDVTVIVRQAEGETALRAAERLKGRIVDGGGDARAEVLFQAAGAQQATPIGELGTRSSAPSGAFDLGVVVDENGVRAKADYAPRARVYEALPAVLLELNGLPTHRDRLAAARSPNGAWAYIEAGGGDRKAERSTSTGADRLSWKHRRWGARTGVDMQVGEDALVGLSAHHRLGDATLSGGDGEIEASGTGVAVSGVWSFPDGVYVDGQVSATWFDADLKSGLRGALKSGAKGFGHAVGVEAGRKIEFGALSLTPSLRVTRSRVNMKDFTDSVNSRVSPGTARGAKGSVAVTAEAAVAEASHVFGSVTVEHEFSGETRVDVSGEDLSSKPGSLRGRLELGGAHVWDDGRFALQGVARYAAGRSGNRDFGGGLSLKMKF